MVQGILIRRTCLIKVRGNSVNYTEKVFLGLFLTLTVVFLFLSQYYEIFKILVTPVATLSVSSFIWLDIKNLSIEVRRLGLLFIITLILSVIFGNIGFVNEIIIWLWVALILAALWVFTIKAYQSLRISLAWMVIVPLFAMIFLSETEILRGYDYIIYIVTLLVTWAFLCYQGELKIVERAIQFIGIIFVVIALVWHLFLEMFQLSSKFPEYSNILFNNGIDILMIFAQIDMAIFPVIINCLLCYLIIILRKRMQEKVT